MVEQHSAIEVFCSYASEDEKWLGELETHLRLLQRQGLISLWHNQRITAGMDWSTTIDTHLETASVILLLVSASFFASDYCYGVEMRRALERQQQGQARVVPILVRSVDWKDAPFAHLPVLPTDATPVASHQDTDAAFADVSAGVRRLIVEDLPLLPASASRISFPKIWNVPYPRNPFFLGREEDLSRLRHHVHAGQAMALSQPQAISGLGGIGKTQLALEYAYRFHQDYQVVLWARAETRDALMASYVAIASLLRLPEREVKEQEVMMQAVKVWLQTQQGWLLILDNADDLALAADFLPSAFDGHLVLTTRAVATGRLASRMEIETLPPEQGALLLLRRAGLIAPDAPLEHASSQVRDLAVRLSEDVGGLPLALDQAGAYLEETGMDLTSYAELYQRQRATLLSQRRGLIDDHPAPVATTWSLSFERVQDKNPAAAHLLRMTAFLSPDAIPEELFTGRASVLDPILAPVAADPLSFNQGLEALRAYSLIRRDPTSKVLSVHRLVQAVLQDRLSEPERCTWAERAVLAINAAFPNVEPGTWSQCERLLPQALFSVQLVEEFQIMHSEAGRLLYMTAWYLKERARYQEAQVLYRHALHIQEQALGPEHLDVARSLNGLAVLYHEQGKYAEAEPLYQRALAVRERLLGPEHPLVAQTLNNLATLHYEQGKYAEAEPLYQRALAVREQLLGPEHPDVTFSLNNLANLYYDQGKYREAEPLLQRALRTREQLLGPDHPDVAYPLNNLANLYREQGKYREAEPLLRRAFIIWEQSLGPDHPQVAYAPNNLGDLYRDQGKYAEAEPLYQRALTIWEQSLGPDHPQVAYPLNGLATLYRDQGKYAEAEPPYQRALHIREQQLGPDHPETAETIHDLAVLREQQGHFQEALALYRRAFVIRERALGSDHPKTSITRERLTALRGQVGQEGVAPQDDPSPEQRRSHS